MSDRKDENDRAREGTLPTDPSAGTEKAKLRVVDPKADQPTPEPSSVPQERALLGALLWAAQNHPETLRVRAVTDLLESGEPFYLPPHRRIFDAMIACEKANAEHDPVAVNAELARAGEYAGGLDALRALVDGASTVSERQARIYAQAIRDTWARRQVISDAKLLIADAHDPKKDPATLVAQSQSVGTQFANRVSTTSAVVQVNDSAAGFIKRMMSSTNTAMMTGLRDLDAALNGGLRPKEVSIIAARTNTGKSALSSQIAEYMVSSSDDIGALYVTLEMGHEMFTARMLSAKSGVPLSNLRRAVLNPTQWSQLTAAAASVSDRALFFADSPSQTLASIYAAAADASRRLGKIGKKLGLVVVDHIGLVKPSAELLKKANREQQVAETSRGLRFIATELDCHVIGIAQIGRGAEVQKGPETMPKLHHLRESGSLEQDADLVLILHRKRDAVSGMFENTGHAALAIAKGRMDETAIILLGFESARTRFLDWNGHETFADFYMAQDTPGPRRGHP